MKCALIAAATIAALSTPAIAGGPTVVAEDPSPAAMPAPAPVTDWSGAYAGVSYGRTSGEEGLTGTTAVALNDGTATGLHAGYLWQNNSFVYGGEVAFSDLLDVVPSTAPSCCELTQNIDLKGRFGFAANRTLVYGVLGYSLGSYTDTVGDSDLKGPAYGLGVDVMATERLTVGLEYLVRDISGPVPGPLPLQDVLIDLETVSLRVGFKF